MKTINSKIKLLILGLVVSAFLTLSANKGLSQWIVNDPPVLGAVTAGFTTANTALSAIEGSVAAIDATTIDMMSYMNIQMGHPIEASKSSAKTAAAITAAQLVPDGDKLLSIIVSTGALKGLASASKGNTTLFGAQLYSKMPTLPSINPIVYPSLTLSMRKYSALEEAATTYYLLMNVNKPKITALEKDLSLQMAALNAAISDAEVQKIHTSINALNTQILAIQAQNEMAANNVKVIALSNENNEKKEADLSAISKQSSDAQTALIGVLAMGQETWD